MASIGDVDPRGRDRRGEPAPSRFRRLLEGPELVFLMEAHDGLSARIAEVEGFEAIWASGFSMSTALGLRDSEEASWSQLLFVVECMVEATSIPVVVDGDTGHGNFNTARRLVRSAERLGSAGVCLEDKIFPKLNSFVGDDHKLADVDEFCGKIAACKAAQAGPEFSLIARTEALIAGEGLDEALRRADAYREAGADAIFIHSRMSDADEVTAFAREWQGRLPVLVSPTTYASTSADVFRRSGISGVIWANQSMRAAAAAMRRACREIHMRESATCREVHLAPLDEIFELMRYDELADAERRFVPPFRLARVG